MHSSSKGTGYSLWPENWWKRKSRKFKKKMWVRGVLLQVIAGRQHNITPPEVNGTTQEKLEFNQSVKKLAGKKKKTTHSQQALTTPIYTIKIPTLHSKGNFWMRPNPAVHTLATQCGSFYIFHGETFTLKKTCNERFVSWPVLISP